MNKKILASISLVAFIAIVAIGGTIAYFNDAETSSGNIIVAGTMNLKVDHLKQTYNGVDCKTCSVSIISDTNNTVVSTVGGDDPVPFPHAAAQVSQPHTAWTVTGDIPGAVWIWATDPTTAHDSSNVDVYYTFQKTFEWWGPIDGATLSLGVGIDNGYEITLNGSPVGSDWGEYNYQSPADVYTNFASLIQQGTNTLQIKVKNQAQSGGTPSSNPGGLLYKLTIDGNCGDDYFKTHCKLWDEKDLATGDTFFDFDDVKPGDSGTNLISLHFVGNDAWSCFYANKSDAEPEDISEDLNVVIWYDEGDGIYEGETPLYEGKLINTSIPLAQSPGSPIAGNTTKYIGLAWCFGTQTVNGTIACDGSSIGNEAQGDTLNATLTAYAEQWRNNPNFVCSQTPYAPKVLD